MRVGLGVDAHGFDASVPLMLGGVEFPDEPGLAGHSDGDVVAHALIDALLGAANLGDIGALFPSDDNELSGISSLLLLRRAYRRVRDSGYELVNAHCVLIGERPRVADRRAEMIVRLAETLGVEPGRIAVSITASVAFAADAARGLPPRPLPYCGSATDPSVTTTSPSRTSDSTASRSRPLERPPATSRSVSARRWRNEPSNCGCLRRGS